MVYRQCLWVLGCLLLAVTPAAGHGPDQAPHQTFAMGDLQLESGERIRDCFLTYVTHGTLNAAKDNAVLMLPPFVGDHHHNEALIGKGKAFDTDTLFVICADLVGGGLSVSPSTSATQRGPAFPRYTLRDMVEAQHRLVTEQFGIKTLRAVTGASMGGMLSLQWAVSYPDSVQAVVALVPTARLTPWTSTLLELHRQAIVLDPAWNGGHYTRQPEQGLRLLAGLLFGIASSTPQAVNASAGNTPAQAPEHRLARLKKYQDLLWKTMDANDVLSQIAACESFDLGREPGFAGDTRRALAAIRARTLILLGDGDLVLPESSMQKDAACIPDVTVVRVPSAGPDALPLGHAAGTSNAALAFKQRVIADFMRRESQPAAADAAPAGEADPSCGR